MKKTLILALFVLGIYNASAFAMVQEIVLTEMYFMTPFDDPKRDTLGKDPDPTRIIASIDGNRLSVNTEVPAYVEVVVSETGEIVAEDEFEGQTTMSIPEEGDYEVYIYTELGIVMVGEFSVK